MATAQVKAFWPPATVSMTTPAVLTANFTLHYNDLAEQVAARCQLLRQQGLRAGQVVLTPAGTADVVVMLHALARLNAVLLPISHTVASATRDQWLTTAAVEWCWQSETHQLITTGLNPPSTNAAAWSIDDPLTAVVSTSGSSGAPKLALFRRSSILASARAVNERLHLHHSDRWLCCLPMQHVGGLAISYRCAVAGATVVLQPQFVPTEVNAALHDHAITHLSLVPIMLARLLELNAAPPASLQAVLIGGQALEYSLAQRALTAGWPLHLSYGMTETFSLCASQVLIKSPLPDLSPAPDLIKSSLPSLIKSPLPPFIRGGEEVFPSLQKGGRGDLSNQQLNNSDDLITTNDYHPLPLLNYACPPCNLDQSPQPLQIHGAILMAGYATPERRPGIGLNQDGWFTTADVACQLPNNTLQILGRADDCIVIAGMNIWPAAIEQQLLKIAGVMACVVLGIPAPDWGGQLFAFYTGSAAPDELMQWSRAHLRPVQRPRVFIQRDQLPLLPSGKWDRQQLFTECQAMMAQIENEIVKR
ncbi:class I adenylate-forming enzyme family protein [Thiospirillum jenense]|uniref:AMP-binding protein n=1 Tax=Thiospirillum jenense TaxID=1653858 RepID=A0A839HG62_9GAMM|nr:AMP-binding protein [Thiospirillum jenense]MBB1125919.1 AMP-binding protein [Thiospirillum jenense]